MVALMQRFGVSPIAAAQGTRVPSAGFAARGAELVATADVAPHAALSTQTAVDRKADDRVLPRGRRL
jgi:hypothetical protein